MPDLRHQLRPLLHSGIAFKVSGAIDEVLAAGDPDLVDWALGPAKIDRLGDTPHRAWRVGDARTLDHPSLDEPSLVRLVLAGTSKRCAKLRSELGSMCVEGDENGELLDLAFLSGGTELRTLRVHGRELPCRWEWRAEVARREVTSFATIASLTGLEHLIVAAVDGVDLAAIARLPRLRRLELSATDVASLSALASTKLETLYVAACPNLAALDALPATLRRVHLEDLPALRSVAALAALPALEELYVGGVELPALPALPTKAAVRFEPARPERTDFDPPPEL